MTIATIDPHAASAMLAQGAQLIDVRGANEHGRERIAAARNVPLDALTTIEGDGPIIFHAVRASAPRFTLPGWLPREAPIRTFSTAGSTRGKRPACRSSRPYSSRST